MKIKSFQPPFSLAPQRLQLLLLVGGQVGELVLQQHEVLRTETQTGTEDVDNALSLRRQCVHNGRVGRDQRRLHQIGLDRQDWIEPLELRGRLGLHLHITNKYRVRVN